MDAIKNTCEATMCPTQKKSKQDSYTSFIKKWRSLNRFFSFKHKKREKDTLVRPVFTSLLSRVRLWSYLARCDNTTKEMKRRKKIVTCVHSVLPYLMCGSTSVREYPREKFFLQRISLLHKYKQHAYIIYQVYHQFSSEFCIFFKWPEAQQKVQNVAHE